MIVIKRDGTTQEFSADKLNKWAEWASKKLGGNVDWIDVVLSTMSKLPEKVTSKQLQESLIQACLDNNSWSYNLMAGRLYAALTFKDLYGGEIPTVKELHRKLVGLGLMVELDYSDEEYEIVEKLINHKLDYNATYFELQHIRKKYALQNRVTETEYESQQFVYMRMAMALAETEPKEDRMFHLARWYEHFSEKRINAPTPNYVNLGTPLKGYASCMLYTTEDSAKSLAVGDHMAYMMTCQSAGIGSHLNTRSLGDEVRGGAIKHQGKLPYYRALEGAVHANLQSGRGGACTTYFTCYDPEIETLLLLKNPTSTEDKKIRGLDYNFGANKFFARKAARNETIFTFNSYTAPDLYDAFYSDDQDLFAELYNKYENDKKFIKKYLNARDILIAALNESYETGRMYLHFPDEMNTHTPFKETIYSSNLCVAPETQVLTDNGYHHIVDLAGQKVNVWNGQEWSNVDVVKTGNNQKLITVTTDSGISIDCTEYHKFYVSTDYKGTIVEKRAFELAKGDKLIKFDLPVIEGDKKLDKAYLNGFYSADGCHHKGKNIVYLYGDKRELVDLFKVYEHTYHSSQDSNNRDVFHMTGLKNKFFVPDASYTIESRLQWLAGYLDGDGSICRTPHANGVSEQITASSTELGFLQELQLMLQTLGVQSKITKMQDEGVRPLPKNDGSGELGEYHCKDCYRLLIPVYESFKLLDLGLELKRLKISKVVPQRDSKRFVQVHSVVDNGRFDDTYCFREAKRGMGMFNGILTGQCAEIALPTKGYQDMQSLYSQDESVIGEIGLCSLAGINVDKIKNDSEYEDAMYYALKMIDKCIDMSEYVLPHLEVTAKARRSAGVGIIGLAHYLAKNKLSYSSQEGLNEIHKLSERHYYYALKASLKLAKELGNAKWMNKTKWPDGWLPIDTYAKSVDELVTVDLQYDWETLRSEIISNGGIRHSVLVAHMPSESSSIASATTNGLYPIRSLTLIKGDANKVTYWAAPESEKLAKWYESAWDIKPIDLIKVYGIVQKFTDQAISADLYSDVSSGVKISSSDMMKDYFALIKYGNKTRYYMNTLTTRGTSMDDSDENCVSCTL